jgi:hypothetical protein
VNNQSSAGVAQRLLVVSREATHPTNKGNRARIADLCNRAESLGWEVHLAHLEQNKRDAPMMAEHWGERYHPIPYRYPISFVRRFARRMRGLLTNDHEFAIDDWYDDGVNAQLQELHRQHRFDAIMVEYAHQSKAFLLFDERVLKILDTHDSLAHRFARQEEFGRRRTGFSTTPAQEALGFSRADVLLAIQEREAEDFRSRTDTAVVTVGHRVPVVPPSPRASEGRLMFLGSGNQANVDGLSFFLSEIWPRIAESSSARLLVAGRVAELVEIPAGVETMPAVANIDAAYDPADIVIVPIRFGTGLKIKTIEALGRGKPTVSTLVGAEGLESARGTALVVADSPEDFASAVRSLLDDAAERRRLASAAMEFARAWNEASEQAFASVLRSDLADSQNKRCPVVT